MSTLADVAFELKRGGRGYFFSSITSTASTPLAIPFTLGQKILVYNIGSAPFWFVLGNNIAALVGDAICMQRESTIYTVARDSGIYTHISLITESGYTTRGGLMLGAGK